MKMFVLNPEGDTKWCFEASSGFKPSRCIQASFCISEEWHHFLNLKVLVRTFSWDYLNNNNISFHYHPLECAVWSHQPADTSRWTNVDLMLGHHRVCWTRLSNNDPSRGDSHPVKVWAVDWYIFIGRVNVFNIAVHWVRCPRNLKKNIIDIAKNDLSRDP